MKILCVIPARAGSKGIPGKNIADVAGKPLIAHTIEEAKKSGIQDIYVSTDSQEILDYAIKLGATNVPLRPAHLAEDNSTTLEVLKDLLQKTSQHYDAILVLQPTSPLRRFTHIKEAIEKFKGNKDADSLVSVQEVPHHFHPESLMEIRDGHLIHFTPGEKIYRRQEKSIVYARNGAAIYISKPDVIVKNNSGILGTRILPYRMDKISSIDIDSIEDLILAELVLLNMKFSEVNKEWVRK